jgi:hypothetical protein
MRSSGRLLVGALALGLLLGAAGCKKGKAGVVPVNHPATTWVAPEEDEVFPEDEDDDTADGNETEE